MPAYFGVSVRMCPTERRYKVQGERKASAGRFRNTVKTTAMASNTHKMFAGKNFPAGSRRNFFAANQMQRAAAATSTTTNSALSFNAA